MFVINANWQNSWYSCVEINNNYNPPMDWSVFSLYGGGSVATSVFYSCVRNCENCVFSLEETGWNWCCQSSS